STVAIDVFDVLHCAAEVTSCVEPLERPAVAASWRRSPGPRVSVCGATASEVTVSSANGTALCAVPPAVVTRMGPLVTPAGAVTTSEVALAEVIAAGRPLMDT